MLASSLASGLTADPSPRWLVTNGTAIVGPVHTELLLRGYLGGRIPEDCHVREVGWHVWRPLGGIREISNLKRRLARDQARVTLREAAQHLPSTSDAGELLSAALSLAALGLDANAGLVHRYRPPLGLPVTSAVFGVPVERLGEVIAESDPSYRLALRGRGFCGSPRHGVRERLVAERLQHDAPLASVLMTPVMLQGQLLAMLELGRTGHVFRVDDEDDLARFAAEVARRLG